VINHALRVQADAQALTFQSSGKAKVCKGRNVAYAAPHRRRVPQGVLGPRARFRVLQGCGRGGDEVIGSQIDTAMITISPVIPHSKTGKLKV
jgi:hypothetical protein